MNKMEELIAKYNEGLSDPSEIQQLEKLIEVDEVNVHEGSQVYFKLSEQLIDTN